MISRDYPYMYARVSAKRKKLLDRSDYEKLWKMGPNEIARNLEERHYQQEINQLGADHEGVELVELALMKHLSRTMGELVDIAPESLEPAIKTYLRRYDIMSIKRLLRWKEGGEEGSIEDFFIPVGSYSIEELKELSEKSFEEICESIEFPNSETDYSGCLDSDRDIREMERDLDRLYYDEVREVTSGFGSMWFDKFMDEEAEYENLKIALRLKKYGMEQEEIREWLVTDEITSTVEEVMDAEDVEEAVEILKNSGELEGLENGDSVEEIEHALEIARLNRALRNLHIEPLGATSIFGYIIAKIIEVKNLRMLIRAKETGIQNLETIKKNLVIA